MTRDMKKGFTLIELLVVVLIIGILAGVSVPVYFRSVEESRSSEATTILSQLASAQTRRQIQVGTYTTNILDLDMGFSSLSYFTISEFGQKITLTRLKNAGGGLGQWTMSVALPDSAGTANVTYTCTPMDACKYLLPQ